MLFAFFRETTAASASASKIMSGGAGDPDHKSMKSISTKIRFTSDTISFISEQQQQQQQPHANQQLQKHSNSHKSNDSNMSARIDCVDDLSNVVKASAGASSSIKLLKLNSAATATTSTTAALATAAATSNDQQRANGAAKSTSKKRSAHAAAGAAAAAPANVDVMLVDSPMFSSSSFSQSASSSVASTTSSSSSTSSTASSSSSSSTTLLSAIKAAFAQPARRHHHPHHQHRHRHHHHHHQATTASTTSPLFKSLADSSIGAGDEPLLPGVTSTSASPPPPARSNENENADDKGNNDDEEIEDEDEVDPLERHDWRTLRRRFESDLLTGVLIFAFVFAAHVSTVFSALGPVLADTLFAIAIALGIFNHYVLPHLRLENPWCLFSRPLLKPSHWAMYEPNRLARLECFECLHVVLIALEKNIFNVLVVLSAVTASSDRLLAKYQPIDGSFGFVACFLVSMLALKLTRSSFAQPARHYQIFLVAYLLHRFDTRPNAAAATTAGAQAHIVTVYRCKLLKSKHSNINLKCTSNIWMKKTHVIVIVFISTKSTRILYFFFDKSRFSYLNFNYSANDQN